MVYTIRYLQRNILYALQKNYIRTTYKIHILQHKYQQKMQALSFKINSPTLLGIY